MSKPVLVGVSHALIGFGTFYSARRRREHTPAAAKTSITKVDGLGTAAISSLRNLVCVTRN